MLWVVDLDMGWGSMSWKTFTVPELYSIPILFFLYTSYIWGGGDRKKQRHISEHTLWTHTFLGSGNEQGPIHGEPELLGLEGTEGSILASRPELLCCVFLPHNSRALCTRQDNDWELNKGPLTSSRPWSEFTMKQNAPASLTLATLFGQKHLIWNSLGSLGSLQGLVGMNFDLWQLLWKILCSQPEGEQGHA